MDIGAYLERINYRGTPSHDATTLRALHRAHLLTVPFENLDVRLGNPIVLDEEALCDKIVRRRRGGFCFELNGLFAVLLRELGFRVTMLNSLLSETQNGCGLAFDHPILLVELDERWIVDVGFSDAYRVPLRLDVSGDQAGLHSRYRLTPDGDGRWKFWELENEEWVFHYAFSLRPARLGDFLEACHHYETSPKSSFTQKLICTRATADGHISLTNQRLTICHGEQKQEETLPGDDSLVEALRTHFGIALQGRFPQPVSV